MYAPMEHPRWGPIMGVVATKTINLGHEVLAHYNYRKSNSIPGDFPWYWKLKEQMEPAKTSQEKGDIKH